MDLFSSVPFDKLPGTPLAERLRPRCLNEVLGQHQVQEQLQSILKQTHPVSMIFWGPPGTGKTTVAEILSKHFHTNFIRLNATESGSKLLREIGEKARSERLEFRCVTILFVDEIHRWNQAQQDILLPFIEKGDLILIGATTENPSYSLNRALLSRCRLIVFKNISDVELRKLSSKAFLTFGLDQQNILSSEAQDYLISSAGGDGRRLISAVEAIGSHLQTSESKPILSLQELKDILGSPLFGGGRTGDQHYDLISALIKSIRGSDPDAALYYLARMLKIEEDPLFIARRLVILASEDVGNADPRALQIAIAGAQAVELIGLPEAAINLSQVVTYLASAPKSNRSYLALKKAQEFVGKSPQEPVPLFLRSGNKGDYKYPHDFTNAWIDQNYWPETLKPQIFYEPSDCGFEKNLKEFQKWLKRSL